MPPELTRRNRIFLFRERWDIPLNRGINIKKTLLEEAPTEADVRAFDTLPIRKRVSGVTSTSSSTSASPKPSDHTSSPFNETAIETPGTPCSDMKRRMTDVLVDHLLERLPCYALSCCEREGEHLQLLMIDPIASLYRSAYRSAIHPPRS